MTKMPETSKKKDFLELMVLENSVHGCFALSALPENHGSRNRGQRKLLISWWTGSKEEGGVCVCDQIKPSKGLPPVAYFLQIGSTP